MRTKYFIRLMVFVVVMVPATHVCTGQTITDTTEFKQDIPIYEDGSPSLFYDNLLRYAHQLNIDTLQNGYDSLQIRVWYLYALRNFRYVLVVKRESNAWTATLHTVFVDWKDNTETVTTKKTQQLFPKNGWDNFLSKFFALQITTLPDMDNIPDLHDTWTDGVSYTVEVATKKQYRFYGYHLPEKFADKYWQAGNMVDVLKLLQSEFGVVSGLKGK